MITCLAGYYVIMVRINIYVTINFKENISLDKCGKIFCVMFYKKINKIVQFTGMGRS